MRKLSLSEWASVAEVISAVAVVASLIYLAIQVRENTMLSAQEAVSSAIAEFNEFDRLIAVNADLASIIMRGEQGSSSLSAKEQRRFEHLISIETGIYERWHTDSERTGIGREHDVLMKKHARRTAVERQYFGLVARQPRVLPTVICTVGYLGQRYVESLLAILRTGLHRVRISWMPFSHTTCESSTKRKTRCPATTRDRWRVRLFPPWHRCRSPAGRG